METAFYTALIVIYTLGAIGTLAQGTKPRKPLTERQLAAAVAIEVLVIAFAVYGLVHG